MKLSDRFHFRPLLSLCVLAALTILIALGTWQMRRLEWKRDLIAQVESRLGAAPIPFDDALARAGAGENMEYAPVIARGVLRPEFEARLFGSYDGEAGVFVFAPLALERANAFVYVNLGFAPQRVVRRGFLLSGGPADGPTPIEGLFRYAERPGPPASWFVSREKSANGLWFVREPKRFAADAGIDAIGYYIDQFAVEGRQWPRGGTTRLEFRNPHLQYALTWFGMAAALIGVWAAFSLQDPPPPKDFNA